jgi:hypothetical protein
VLALRDTETDLILIDADTAEDVVASVAAAALVQSAPIIVLGVNVGRGEALAASCLAHGAAAVFSKASGAAALGLAGAEGDALVSKLILLAASANGAAS